MDKLIVKGIKNIEGMEFHDIEGGFGEGKKAMLAKEIAEIHNKPLGDINRRINDNIKRFKKGIDIIDLAGTDFVMDLKHNGIYTQNALNVSKNIYLLSERGYSKLLKILEDDTAWEQYEKIVDGYFNMRSGIPKMSKELQAIFMLDEKTEKIDERLTGLENNMTIDHGQARNIKLAVDLKVRKLCCGNESAAYQNKNLRSKVYRYIWRSVKDYFNVTAYHNLLRKDIDNVTNYINNLGLQGALLREVQETNNQMCFKQEA
ncbi:MULTISPECIES: ORF6C domain-containing protein [unclassified Clostridium]|uniref:ORF6C domain-containing protein n=1 Tax=unclassified Clostridium TaxID=2614128 RepID=UPI000297FB96|nr:MULTISPECIES: ORF6C domain-containing protein [unclassified Clostridium]EKQ56288.1 MAG: ORF6N domain-containing protein [Clostridium sp. Maddingley MBC34-26]